jgi:hypothetical protein
MHWHPDTYRFPFFAQNGKPLLHFQRHMNSGAGVGIQPIADWIAKENHNGITDELI